MNKIFKFILFFYLIINIFNTSISNENFFSQGLKFFKSMGWGGGGGGIVTQIRPPRRAGGGESTKPGARGHGGE